MKTSTKKKSLLTNKKYLKTILQSQRANIFWLEHCRLVTHEGRIKYITSDKNIDKYYNIPFANTSFILLGQGTSISTAATILLAAADVNVGHVDTDCGLVMAPEIVWLTNQNEYRPTEYMQNWASFWFDDQIRLGAAKYLQKKRIEYFKVIYEKEKEEWIEHGIRINLFESLWERVIKNIENATSVEKLLTNEAYYIKKMYSIFATHTHNNEFKRNQEDKTGINGLLTTGNYLSYGISATMLWTLGISHSFPLMHGKTRRGGLVFDIADVVKDALVLPTVFLAGSISQKQIREILIDKILKYKTMKYIFELTKKISYNFKK